MGLILYETRKILSGILKIEIFIFSCLKLFNSYYSKKLLICLHLIKGCCSTCDRASSCAHLEGWRRDFDLRSVGIAIAQGTELRALVGSAKLARSQQALRYCTGLQTQPHQVRFTLLLFNFRSNFSFLNL